MRYKIVSQTFPDFTDPMAIQVFLWVFLWVYPDETDERRFLITRFEVTMLPTIEPTWRVHWLDPDVTWEVGADDPRASIYAHVEEQLEKMSNPEAREFVNSFLEVFASQY